MADSITVPLNLPEFRVLEQKVNHQQRTITVSVEARHSWGRCPHCGKPTRHDVQDDRWRTVQDLSALQYRVFLCIRQRRLRCPRCPKRFRETFDSVDLKQRQTQRLQAQLLAGLRGRSLAEAARASPVSYRIVCYLCFKVGGACAQPPRPLPRRIGVDEFARQRGHRYATVVVALTRHRVAGVAPERTQAALESLLRASGARPERVQEAVIDIWEAFFLALRACCPQATITIDRFHVERHVWEAVEKCRKRLSQGQRKKDCPLKAQRHLLVTPTEQLSKEQKQERDALLEGYPDLQRGVHLANRLHRWYSVDKDRQHANWQLSYWLRLLVQSEIPELVELAQMFKRWRKEIVNYFVSYSTNGVTEGFNTKIKLLKRLGYGRLTFAHLKARIFLECGRHPP